MFTSAVGWIEGGSRGFSPLAVGTFRHWEEISAYHKSTHIITTQQILKYMVEANSYFFLLFLVFWFFAIGIRKTVENGVPAKKKKKSKGMDAALGCTLASRVSAPLSALSKGWLISSEMSIKVAIATKTSEINLMKIVK